MSGDQIDQRDIRVGNYSKYNGRDDNSTQDNRIQNNVNIVLQTSGVRVSKLAPLFEKLRRESGTQREHTEKIAQLQHYLLPIDDGVVKGVERKLESAGRQHQIREAKRLKEVFVKFLVSHELSMVAQQIIAHLLADLEMYFSVYVSPKIREGASAQEIDVSVIRDVIEPVVSDAVNDVMPITALDVRGMLYFLTGNCHLEWE